MYASGKSARHIVDEKGLVQVSDESEIESAIDQVLSENPKEVEQFRAGKGQTLRLFRRPGHEEDERKGKSAARQ